MSNGMRPRQQREQSPLSQEEIAQFQEADRQYRLELMPPQVDVNGIERQCVYCQSVLNPIRNRHYDGAVGGFCNKLCMKGYEKKLLMSGEMTAEDAENEIDKYEDWKPRKHSPIV